MRGMGEGLVQFYVVSLIVAAVVGWAVIQGVIYLVKHLAIGWKP